MDIDAAVSVLEVGFDEAPVLLLPCGVPELDLVLGAPEGDGLEHVVDADGGLSGEGGTFWRESNSLVMYLRMMEVLPTALSPRNTILMLEVS